LGEDFAFLATLRLTAVHIIAETNTKAKYGINGFAFALRPTGNE
jgi:hypothetical protein